MHALPLLLAALCILAIAYRYYSAFIATKILVLDDSRITPAHRLADGHNYVPTNKWVLFGHHFAAITGAGPLVGPVLAAQYGYLPGYLWLVLGVVLGGSVHDFVVLVGSIRHDGKSLAEIARVEIGPRSGLVAGFAVLFIVILAISAMAKIVVNALAESAWGTFTIGVTIPIALFMGLYMYKFRKGKITEASTIGVLLLIFAVIAGKWIATSHVGSWFLLSEKKLTLAIAAYGFFASVLPVWMLLCPRDYLSSYMKIGTIVLLILGIAFVNPKLEIPAISKFSNGGPVVPGKIFPFVFITIACGAISGFHGLISSGTTPKMINKESDARMIGYGAMLIEGVVGIVALIAAASLHQGDYFAINTPPDKFATLGLSLDHLSELEHTIGERLQGRAGGAVSLAVGMSEIFSKIPGFSRFISYWYHFAIMFEALFILTTVDSGTRVARFLVQEFGGRIHPKFAKTDWMPGSLLATGIVCFAWGYFVWTGSVDIIWPMLGISNQLLACIALCTMTTMIVNLGRARYMWVTLIPLFFVGIATQTAGYQMITQRFIPQMIRSGISSKIFQGWLLTSLCAMAMAAMIFIFLDASSKWIRIARSSRSNLIPAE